MTNYTMTQANDGTVQIEGELTIYDAAEFKTALLNRLGSTQSLKVDLAGVTELDCSGVQVMILAQQEAAAASKTLQWEKHSPAVVQVLGILNLGGKLGQPVSLVWS
jgi:anti-anti-sigma factor